MCFTSSSISANNCPKLLTSFKTDNEINCFSEYKLAVSCTAYRTSILLLANRNPGQSRQSPSPSEFNRLEDPSLPSQNCTIHHLDSVKQHYRPALRVESLNIEQWNKQSTTRCEVAQPSAFKVDNGQMSCQSPLRIKDIVKPIWRTSLVYSNAPQMKPFIQITRWSNKFHKSWTHERTIHLNLKKCTNQSNNTNHWCENT